jgi:hypothetical protein
MNARIRTLILASIHLALAAGAAAAEAKVRLAVEYPRPVFEGTPKPIPVANLEPLRGKAQEVLVPPGTVLLSRGKRVTSSDEYPVIGELSFVTDGDKTGVDGAILELGPERQWVQIDLGASERIHAIVVWHYHREPRVYHDVVVQLSDDPGFTRGVTTIYNNDHDSSSKLGRGADPGYIETNFGRLIAVRGQRARYVRLYSQGNTSDELNHYCEVEVHGERAAR